MRSIERYSTQHITTSDRREVDKVLRSDWLTQGPCVADFEAALAKVTGAKHAIAVSSGTAALHLAYIAAFARTMKKDPRVLTSPLSFVATASMALAAGGEVGFRDVDYETGNASSSVWDPDYYDVLTVVHYAGRAAQIPRFAVAYGSAPLIVEDACHALGAWDFDLCSPVGSCAHSLATCFSFHPVKPITTGEGGAITTNDDDLAKHILALRSHGRDGNGECRMIGFNYRLPETSAALGLNQLRRLEDGRKRRQRLAWRYYERLASDRRIVLPPFLVDTPSRNAWHLLPARIPAQRDRVLATMLSYGIGVQVHYKPIHHQPLYLGKYYGAAAAWRVDPFPEAEAWGREELSLPLHVKMSRADVDKVCDTLARSLE